MRTTLKYVKERDTQETCVLQECVGSPGGLQSPNNPTPQEASRAPRPRSFNKPFALKSQEIDSLKVNSMTSRRPFRASFQALSGTIIGFSVVFCSTCLEPLTRYRSNPIRCVSMESKIMLSVKNLTPPEETRSRRQALARADSSLRSSSRPASRQTITLKKDLTLTLEVSLM